MSELKDSVEPTTSAKRLHSALLKIRKTKGATLFEVLPSAMGVIETDPNRAAIKALSTIEQMIGEIEREIALCGMNAANEDFYKKFIPGVSAAFTPHLLGHPIEQVRSRLSDVDLTRIEHLDRVLQASILEQEVEQDEFAELRASLKQALATIDGSAIPDNLKRFIIGRLDEISLAVDRYSLLGINGVQVAAAAYLGALALQPEKIDEAVSQEGKSDIWEVVRRCGRVIELAKGIVWVGTALLNAGHDVSQVFTAIGYLHQ